MADNFNKNAKQEVKKEPTQEVKREEPAKKATKPTTFETRAKIEAEVKMIKIGKDPAGRWIWRRSDRINSADKKQRESMLEKIRKGLKV